MEVWDNMLAYAITAGVAGTLLSPLLFLVARRRLLPIQRLRQGRWSGYEVVLTFILLYFVPGAAISILEQLGFYQVIFVKPPSGMRKDIWAAPLSMFLTLAFFFWVLFTGSKTRPAIL